MLTIDQYAAFKASVLADPVLSTLPASNANSIVIADAYNAPASPVALVWDRSVIVDRVHDGIDYTKYTPSDTPDGTAVYTNRILAIQTKQMNLQSMLIGRSNLDATKANLRNGLKDATTAIPAGAGGANVHPGGAGGGNVLAALCRPTNATRVEKLFSSGTATTGSVTGEILTAEGTLSKDEVQAALGW